jgi:hypothetical protein
LNTSLSLEATVTVQRQPRVPPREDGGKLDQGGNLILGPPHTKGSQDHVPSPTTAHFVLMAGF